VTEAVFDSSILIDALNDVKPAQAELSRYTRRFISRMTWIEVMAGALPDDGLRAEGFMGHFTVIELNEEIARRAAALRSERKRLKLTDSIILASAQVSGRILVTRNIKDFPAAMLGIRIPYQL
jgi:predicted nucleic acid-binding protein